MNLFMREYFRLTKFGIVVFVVISGITGYWLSYEPFEQTFSWVHFVQFVLGLYFVSSGSCALNQAQEVNLDKRMDRTSKRPIPSGFFSLDTGYLISVLLVVLGIALLYRVSEVTAFLGLLTILLYNILYTIYWKPNWTFAAVPGAIPGAMPVVLGYSANAHTVFTGECLYVFMVMFLWQMPHFWSLAIRFKNDYAKGGVPVLPVKLGVGRTLFHMGLYTFTYVALAVASPWFVNVYFIYLAVVLPLSLKVLYEFLQFYKENGQTRWLPFFMWTNISVLIFLAAPVLDKWHLILLSKG